MKITKEKEFLHIVALIKDAKNKAYLAINTELIDLYCNIGKYMSKKLEQSEWGDSVVEKLADYIKENEPELKGFSRRNIFNMINFYNVYKNDKIMQPLAAQLSWSNNIIILSKTKSIEEKEFYIKLSIKEKYSKRELERQIDSGYFERTMLSNTKLSPPMRQLNSNTKVSTPLSQIPKDISSIFKDTYILDFLDLPKNYSEKDLRTALINSFKDFLLEFGKDFAFIGEEYRVQVGKNDYFIDLLFYHRTLQCLVAFELKIEDFKPEFIGKLNFYLEALDRDVKKSFENPSVGIILCKSKDDEVVEYALSRNLSPTLVSEYKTKLIDKNILRNKLHELFNLINK